MIFSSVIFLFLFLPVVLAVNFLLPRSLRNFWLMVMSLLFYAWGEGAFVVVMLASIVANYGFGLAVARLPARGKTWVFAVSVLTNLAILAVFKYSNFLVSTVNPLLAALHFAPIVIKHVHLPIGISFFTFHAISYVADVYHERTPVQRSAVNFALYETLFPQLVAGPIVRYQDVADQIDARRETVAEFASGVRRFVTGLSKKVLIANILAAPADQIFALAPDKLTASVAWLGILFYALQIYFDFSGYSDMAIGLGRMLGFRFVENFNYPYVAHSIQDFWRRWHISLSTWFRDYFFIPLELATRANPYPNLRVSINIMLMMLLVGLWHGPSWNFVIFGGLHGLALVVNKLWTVWNPIKQLVKRPPVKFAWMLCAHLLTLGVVLMGFVLFRADTMPAALAYLQAMGGWGLAGASTQSLALYIDRVTSLAFAVGLIGSMPVVPYLRARLANQSLSPCLENTGLVVRLITFATLFLFCAMQLAAGTYNPFIYFRF